ncbi:MAG: cyclase family protein [Desulfarculaceae bacterium]|nr:cyclase family protein [Desulfarculaceae bacterium]
MNPEELAALAQKAKVYDLGMDYFVGMPHFPTHPPFTFSLGRLHGDLPYGDEGLTAANCVFSTGGHTGTHIDALGHISVNRQVHGVGDITPFQGYEGLKKGGIEEVDPIFCKGHLLDIAGHLGVDCLESGYPIDPPALEGASRACGAELGPGDAVLIRTGWIQHFSDPQKYIGHEHGAPGLVESGARWLADKGVKFVGSDTSALEKTPSPGLPVHGILLVENGIHIMEVLNLEELAADKAADFLFIALPLKIRGGTGSPIRPIAVVL